MSGPAIDHDVLVVGGGPVGMAALLALRRAGVSALAVDRDHGPTTYPKSRVVSVRSMELFRRWGIADRVRAVALPRDWTERLVVARDLAGEELGRVESPVPCGPSSPEHRVLCTQDRLERVLADEIEAVAPGALLWDTPALAVADVGSHVEVTVAGIGESVGAGGPARPSGRRVLRARYVVLADGCRGLGADPDVVPGAGTRRRLLCQMSFRFHTDLTDLVAHRPAFVTYLVGPRYPVALLVVDGVSDWIAMTLCGQSETVEDYPERRLRELLADIVGRPIDHPTVAGARIERPRLWHFGYRIADRFAHGRVLRAGDAAHEIPPTGATGMNLGLADIDSLVWRLAAILDGWGDPVLLDGYHAERHAIADRTARWTRDCLNAAPNLAGAANRGDDALLARATAQLTAYVDHPGLDLGPLLPPGVAQPLRPVADGRPGSRQPHRALGDGDGSTLDYFHDVPVLMVGGTGDGARRALEDARDWAARMRRRYAIPVRVHAVAGGDGMVLVRPDGYVGWRGEALTALEAALCRLAGRERPAA